MIKILIIEDNIAKLKRVVSFLNDICNIKDENISYADNIRAGREYLISHQYDLLLLDLVLPFNEGDEPSSSAGSKFLDEIHYNPNINIPIHIIGLTEFDNVFSAYVEQFEDKLWGLINFDLGSTDWMDKLKTKIFYLQNYKLKYKEFIENEDKYDVAIITALNIEFENLTDSLQWEKRLEIEDTVVYYSTSINTKSNNNIKVIACCINQMGMQAAAAVASKVITKFSPKYLFISGICAGIKDSRINLGDIIVAKQCWNYEVGKISEDDKGNLLFKPEIQSIPTNQGIISKLTDFSNSKQYLFNIYNDYKGSKPTTMLDVKFGTVGSGPYVLNSKIYLNDLISAERKLLGIDMEGFGIYQAAQYFNNTIPILIKGVSDYGDINKKDDFQNYASYVSSKFILDFLYYHS